MQLFCRKKIVLSNSEPSQHSQYAALRFTYFTAFAPCAKNARKSERLLATSAFVQVVCIM